MRDSQKRIRKGREVLKEATEHEREKRKVKKGAKEFKEAEKVVKRERSKERMRNA